MFGIILILILAVLLLGGIQVRRSIEEFGHRMDARNAHNWHRAGGQADFQKAVSQQAQKAKSQRRRDEVLAHHEPKLARAQKDRSRGEKKINKAFRKGRMPSSSAVGQAIIGANHERAISRTISDEIGITRRMIAGSGGGRVKPDGTTSHGVRRHGHGTSGVPAISPRKKGKR